jgi:pimeloyl-ACP methyl ester carboxylesterase
MKTGERLSGFTSERKRAAFLAAYDAMLADLWPEHDARDVPTAFGTTRVMTDDRSGAGAAPFVLLAGGGGNSLMWHRYVGPWSRHRRVIAIDQIGDPGRSTQDKPFADGRDLAAWLDEVLVALEVERAHLVGCSYGGWVALRYAQHRPGRAATLTLLDPAGFGKVTARLLGWVLLGALAGLAPRPVRRRAAGWVRNATLLDDDLMRLIRYAVSFRRRMPTPAPLADDELAALTVPVQLLIGEHSVLFDPPAVAGRVTRLMPAARVEIVPGASHDVPMHSVDLVTARTIEFARETEPA